MSQTNTHIFERGDHIYLVGPVAPITPADTEVEELAFAADLRKMAPNEHLGWLRGQYVEADRPNANGALWSADELAIKSLTPMLMPVTVMHDPRTAVGMIADTRLLTPDADSVPRARIDTTLGVWRHRFPDTWDEVAANYAQGDLMQSMECLPAYYDCGECGQRFPNLPGRAERRNWCAHLRGEDAAANGKPVRRLGNVTFTGTGLIFGSRGAKGALDSAHLDVFQEEVAEFHERARTDRRTPHRRQGSMDTIEIKRDEYDALKAAAARVPDLEGKLSKSEEAAAKVPELETKLEQTETAKVAAERERDEHKTKVEEHAEAERRRTLAKDRIGKLGTGFKAKFGEFARTRLEEQAGALSDEEWDGYLKEREEMAGVKRDDGTSSGSGDGGGDNGETFSREEIARSGAGAGGGNGGSGGEPTKQARQSVVGGLVKSFNK